MTLIAHARMIICDTLICDRNTLLFMFELFDSERLFIGTDYPFSVLERGPLDLVTETGLDNVLVSKLRYENAELYLCI